MVASPALAERDQDQAARDTSRTRRPPPTRHAADSGSGDEVPLALVAHDLKAPVAVILGFARLMRRQAARPGGLPAYRAIEEAAQIEAAGVRLLAQLDELLDIARLDAGRPPDLRREEVDLVALARQAVADLGAAAGARTITVQAEVPALVGSWDPVRLRRVLDNLLENAVKYSPEGAAVAVIVRREVTARRPWAVLAVRDRGIGIPAADLPRVFERFHRAVNARERASGAGIGLAGARQIVEQHGGTIDVESAEGLGSVFTVRLPLPVTGRTHRRVRAAR